MIVDELKSFRSKLVKYINYRKTQVMKHEKLTREEDTDFALIYDEISVSAGKYAPLVKEYTGLETIPTSAGLQDIWNWAFSFSDNTLVITALDNCLQATNRTIGKLADDINKGLRDEQGKKIGEPSERPIESPLQIFDAMQFHPKVVEASKDCFIAGNYREAILNAFICFIDYVKERTGLDLDGDDLMNQVFSINYDKEQRRITRYPIIRINELKNKSDRDEQQGFMFLCKGAAGGIRNPKAHKLIPQSNPLHTLEYLAFASLLVRRVEEGEIEKPSNKEQPLDQ